MGKGISHQEKETPPFSLGRVEEEKKNNGKRKQKSGRERKGSVFRNESWQEPATSLPRESPTLRRKRKGRVSAFLLRLRGKGRRKRKGDMQKMAFLRGTRLPGIESVRHGFSSKGEGS